MRDAVEDESEQLPLAPSAVEAVDELGQVRWEVLTAEDSRGFQRGG